ncbi:hypothetical protein O181_016355 [Austropuccinia psidii MF-1]|uniref:Uncharacterized protein n=1 Tax=Austropuccinia psidii MF-1 TaxID=1389203 RepID=A0A9Q3C5N2_9BASI|nr:hypothetical protein [Austropuccinia psidii MF-1]
MGLKRQKQNTPNPLRQDFPIPHIPCKQTLQQPTPGASGTQWLEDLFREPSQHNEPPTPGTSKAPDSQLPSNENNLTSCPDTPCSFIIINNMPFGTPPPPPSGSPPLPPAQSSPHSNDEAPQEFTDLQPMLMIP